MGPDAQTWAVERRIEELAAQAVDRGGLWFFYLACFGVVATGSMHLAGLPGRFEVPCVVSAFLAILSLVVWRTARRGRLTQRRKYLLILPFVLSPSLLFFVSHIVLPAGAASYLTGPFAFVMVLMVVLTGFLFDPRFLVLSGIAAGAVYFGAVLPALPHLEQIRTGDAVLDTELRSLAVWGVRASVLAFTGAVVGALTLFARHLGLSVLRETQEKAALSRLFGQYVSDAVKDRLVERSTEAGERTEVVVLFSDLRGFSSFSEGREPEEIVAQLNRYLDAMVEAITERGGVVDKFIGDAIMAVFGGLVALPNPSQSAVEAALEMQSALEGLNDRFEAEGLPRFRIGVGLHRGVVLQGSIGSRHRKEFTVIGDAVNTAARLESATKSFPEAILASEAVRVSLEGVEVVDHGDIQVKGKQEAVRVFGVRGRTPTR